MESRTAQTGGAALSLDGGMWKGGGRLDDGVSVFSRRGGRMFGRWEGPVFLVLGTLPPEGSHSIWRYHLCLFKRGDGAPLGASGNGRSSPGGRQRDKRVWRRHSPSPGKRGRAPPPCRAEGPSLPAPGPTVGDPPRGVGGCSRQTGREDHRLFNGGRSVPAPGATGYGKNRSANHRPGGGCAGGATVCHPISHAVFGLSIPFFPTCATVPPMKRGI